jgi:hypothetical protein
VAAQPPTVDAAAGSWTTLLPVLASPLQLPHGDAVAVQAEMLIAGSARPHQYKISTYVFDPAGPTLTAGPT